jgi:hypothetical protein
VRTRALSIRPLAQKREWFPDLRERSMLGQLKAIVRPFRPVSRKGVSRALVIYEGQDHGFIGPLQLMPRKPRRRFDSTICECYGSGSENRFWTARFKACARATRVATKSTWFWSLRLDVAKRR